MSHMNIDDTLKQAQALSQNKKEEEARQLLIEVIKLEPNNRSAIIMLAGSYYCTLHFREAVVSFERLVLLEPQLAQASIGLVNAHIALNQKDEALREIERFEALADADNNKSADLIKQYGELKAKL